MAYNRTQQRFDKSIRQAVVSTEAAKDAASAAGLKRRQDRARQEIPVLEKLIADGKNKNGEIFSKDHMEQLRFMLRHRQRIISVEVS